ncbi:MAG: FHA domain-containing protein [Planctomycetes bacterium]|nr:FHA domain-containing protein [Planctomycetota bacterium]
MALRLVPLGEGPTIPVDRAIILIGRHPECDVRIESRKISRRHCCIVQFNDRLAVRDLGSTNGVYLNGQRVEQAFIAPRDELQIGDLRYQVVVNGSQPDMAALKPGNHGSPPDVESGSSPSPAASQPAPRAEENAPAP